MERMEGISMVEGREVVTTGGETDVGDGMGKEVLLGEGVCLWSQSSMGLVGRGRVVHPGVAMLEGRVFREEEQEVKVAVDVRDRELIMCGMWWYEWERSEGRRQRGGVFYSPLGWTLHVSTPVQLSRSLLRSSILSIRSRTCVLMECHSGIGSSQSHILLHLLLNRMVELGSSGHRPCFLSKV